MTAVVSLDGEHFPDEFSFHANVKPDPNQPVDFPPKRRDTPGEYKEQTPDFKGTWEQLRQHPDRENWDIIQTLPDGNIGVKFKPRKPEGVPQSSIPIIRHGETAENEKNIAHGWSDEPLNRRGLEQAEKAAGELKGKEPTLIAYSDLKRSEQTADIIAKKTGAQKVAIPELRTWDIGDFEGKDCGECEKELKPYLDDPNKRIPGGESFNDFRRRVQEGLFKAHSMGADAIVTHNKTERLIDSIERSGEKDPHQLYEHEGGPKPGGIRMAENNVIPGPWSSNISKIRSLTSYGMEGVRGIQRGIIRGRSTDVDLSNVKEMPGAMKPGHREMKRFEEEGTISDAAGRKKALELLDRVQANPELRKDPKFIEEWGKNYKHLRDEDLQIPMSKYDEAVLNQQVKRMQEGTPSRKSPMLRLINPDEEPEPKL